MRHVKITDNVIVGNDLPFVLIAGPCALESREHAIFMARELSAMCRELNIPYVFKSSFDKANRTSVSSGRGIGIEAGLEILSAVREEVGCAVVTDIHVPDQADIVAPHVDLLQIPAFLARQTDLLHAAAVTGKPVHIKKPQWSAAWDMKSTRDKMDAFGNPNFMFAERGTSFGYNNFVVDMRSLPQMAALDVPVIIDATHGIQQPAAGGTCSGGDRRLAPVIARAAMAVGVAGIYIETHQDPDTAPCDGPNMVKLADMPRLLKMWKELDAIAKADPIII